MADSSLPVQASASSTTPTATLVTPVTPRDPAPVRVTLADGCVPSVAEHPDYGSTSAEWIDNPDAAGLDVEFVPGTPTEALICRYSALDAVTKSPDGEEIAGGDLYTSIRLDAGEATSLAAALNAIEPSNMASACQPPLSKARYTAIVFVVPGRSDIDVWLKDWYGCPEVSNGIRSSGLLINGHGSDFLEKLELAAPAAPQQDSPEI